MKKKKLFALLLAGAMSAALFAGCGGNGNDGNNNGDDEGGNPSATQLSAPELTLKGKVISWEAVENADSYTVYKDGVAVSENQSITSYPLSKLTEGSYNFTVKANSTNSAYSASAVSQPVEYTAEPDSAITGQDATTVYFVGDSTVCSFNDSYYLPRYGYGTQLYNFVNSNVTVTNLALSGRSSYSYLAESNYTTLKNSISEGDYLIIGFGHNDQKEDIYADPNYAYTDCATQLNGRPVSFQNILYDNYIRIALEVGATPILCTPIVRLNKANDYTGSSGHITTTGAGSFTGGNYPAAIRKLGEDLGITVVDLTAITKEDYTNIGYEQASNYHAWTGAEWADGSQSEKTPTGLDATHTNLYGAKMNAYYIASELKRLNNPLGAYVLSDIIKPTYDVDYANGINNNYVITGYQPFTPSNKSTRWTTISAEGWYGTAFGSISINSAKIEQNGDGSFTVGTTSDSSGKITSSGDGIAAVFKQLGSNDNFEITAKVTINNYYSNSQSGFGIMLRDDIFIDNKDFVPTSNYVVAGCYGTSDNANINFYRLGGSLTTTNNTGKTIDASEGAEHTLKLVRSGTTVTVTFDSYTYTTEADFDLRSVDSEYMYLCLFATRGTVVTFSDVQYTYNGEVEA